MNKKKVIVTGVTGQDGSYMAEYLLKNTDVEIYGVVRRSSNPNLCNLHFVKSDKRFHFVTADLSDSQSIDGLVKDIKPDYFINLAAQSFVGSSWSLPEQTFDVDAVGVIRCLEAIRKHAPNCRFYNAGSSEEFGDVQYHPQDEKHPWRARSPYGAAKIAARQAVKVWRESYDLYAVQGILFNHESERRGEEFVTRKISKGVARIYHDSVIGRRQVTPIVLGNLDAKRDWSHAEDFVDGIWRMLNQEDYRTDMGYKPQGGILLPEYWDNGAAKQFSKSVKEYVLSSNETHTVREFIEKALTAAKIPFVDANPDRAEPVKGEAFGYGGQYQVNYTLPNGTPLVVVSREFYRPAEVELLHGDSSQARRDLKWEPKVSFDRLVTRMVENDISQLTQ